MCNRAAQDFKKFPAGVSATRVVRGDCQIYRADAMHEAMMTVPFPVVHFTVAALLSFTAISKCADLANENKSPAPLPSAPEQPRANAPTSPVSFRLRLQPFVDARNGTQHMPDAAALAKTEEMLGRRLASIGIKDVVFTQQPPDRITARSDRLTPEQNAAFRKVVTQSAVLDFRTVHGDSDTLLPEIESKTAILDPAWIVLPLKEDKAHAGKQRSLIVSRVPDITSDQIAEAYARYDLEGWGLSLTFDKKAGEKFFDLTRKMRAHVDRFAIVLDGQILSAPTTGVQGGIAGGSCIITGKFTEQEARELASTLMNPLQHPVVIETVVIEDENAK